MTHPQATETRETLTLGRLKSVRHQITLAPRLKMPKEPKWN